MSAPRENGYWGGVLKNSQRNNPNFGNPRLPYTTCFPTSTTMFNSWLVPHVKAGDGSDYEKHVIDMTEALIGKPGIAELAARYWPWITKPTRYWWKVHELFINSEVDHRLRFWRPGKVDAWEPQDPVEFREGSFEDFEDALDRGPVIFGTTGYPGPRGRRLGGHIILVIGRCNSTHVVRDPFGQPPYNTGTRQQQVERFTEPDELRQFSILGRNRARFIGVRREWTCRQSIHETWQPL